MKTQICTRLDLIRVFAEYFMGSRGFKASTQANLRLHWLHMQLSKNAVPRLTLNIKSTGTRPARIWDHMYLLNLCAIFFYFVLVCLIHLQRRKMHKSRARFIGS